MLEMFYQITPSNSNTANIFSFATFISGLTLLVIVYTISGVRYHFRIAITPFPIYKITYFLIALIGVGTLMTDLYFSEGWDTPTILSDPLLIQTFLASIFLLLVLTWMFVAFIYPFIFNRFNYKKFTKAIYVILAKGSDNELSIIADELGRSAEMIVKKCRNIEPFSQSTIPPETIQANYAHDLLMMIGHKKLCRHMISVAPGTAIEFFRAMARYKKFDIPIGQFAVNISAEALADMDSSLYHEDDFISSGLFGHVKPFTKAIYGNYALVESLAIKHCSPLDLPYTFTSDWNEKQLRAYCRCVIITIENYLENCRYNTHSFAITRAIKIIKNSCAELHKINEVNDYYNLDVYKKLHELISFTEKSLELFDRYWPQQLSSFRVANKFNHNIYDSIADLMFDVIFFAAHVTSPPDKCWSIQYSSVWCPFFNTLDNSRSRSIIIHKLRRLLFDSIMQMNRFPNYKSARVLGICLNVMGLTPKKQDLTKNYHSLHKIIIKWIIKNFRNLAVEYPDIAATCLQGNISYNKEKNQLIYSYVSGMKKEQKTVTLQLN